MFKKKQELIEIINFGKDLKKIINEWDPLNLLEFTLNDEYENEIREIREKILKERDFCIITISKIIKEIFKNSFNEEYVSIKENEDMISIKILDIIKKYNFRNFTSRDCDFNKAFLIDRIEKYYKIKQIINEWDPLNIINISFNNEYCYEINKIINYLEKKGMKESLEKEIENIFRNSYNDLYKSKKNEEKVIAKKILEVY